MRTSRASAAFTLSRAMKSQIEVRSISACGRFRGSFWNFCSQTLAALGFDPGEHVADLLGGAAIKTFLNFSTQRFELGLAVFLALFHQPQSRPDHLAGGAVT